MSSEQLMLSIAVAPILSLVIVIAGYIVQNTNLNARTAEIRRDLDQRLTSELGAVRDVMRAELAAVRAEMSRNHSELVHKFADLDQRLTRLEAGR